MWLFLLLFNFGLYPKTMLVTEIDQARDVVVCEDYNGDIWEFDGIEDWEVGDIVSAVMDSKKTEVIYDDEIVMARYGGNVNREEDEPWDSTKETQRQTTSSSTT